MMVTRLSVEEARMTEWNKRNSSADQNLTGKDSLTGEMQDMEVYSRNDVFFWIHRGGISW